MQPESDAKRWGLLTAYYMATPLFVLADAGLGLPVRAAAFSDMGARLTYYVGLILLGLLCRARPRVTPWVGMGESSVNLFTLLLSVLLPIWSAPDVILAGGTPDALLDGPALVNVMLSGGTLIWAFHLNRIAAGG